jgi:predicted unusual protein kinase regulating ubiquinone biosynthesis (AarF/ABC1/UbiB family)
MKSEHKVNTPAELALGWESLLQLKGISRELDYRIRKLISRAAPLTDKIFLKTLKGKEIIAECAEKTRAVRDKIESGRGDVYEALTDLEKTWDDFLKRVYEFRIKAG